MYLRDNCLLMELFFRKSGQGDPIVILHGLYGSSDNWMTIAKSLAEHFEVYLIDQRNHGQSPHMESHTYDDLVEDLNRFIVLHQLVNPILIGHSMGGKTAMRFALKYPNKIKKLIVVDIAPKNYSGYRNYGKVTADHEKILKQLLSIHLPSITTRGELNAILEHHFEDTRLRMFLLKNIRKQMKGGYTWKLNLEVLLHDLPDIMDGFSNITNSIPQPALFIKGGDSNYIDEDDMFEVRKYFPNAELAIIPNAGHWLHYEQPEVLLKTLHYFLL